MPDHQHAQEGLPPLPPGALFVGRETDKVGESPTRAIVPLPAGNDDDVLTVVDGAPAWSPPSGGSSGGLVGDPFTLDSKFTAAAATHVPADGPDGYHNGASCYFHGSEVVLGGDVIADASELVALASFVLGTLAADIRPPFKVVVYGQCSSGNDVVVPGNYIIDGTDSGTPGRLRFKAGASAAEDLWFFTLPNIHALLASALA